MSIARGKDTQRLSGKPKIEDFSTVGFVRNYVAQTLNSFESLESLGDLKTTKNFPKIHKSKASIEKLTIVP